MEVEGGGRRFLTMWTDRYTSSIARARDGIRAYVNWRYYSISRDRIMYIRDGARGGNKCKAQGYIYACVYKWF